MFSVNTAEADLSNDSLNEQAPAHTASGIIGDDPITQKMAGEKTQTGFQGKPPTSCNVSAASCNANYMECR